MFTALLEAEITDEDITSMAAAKNMYQSCLDEGKFDVSKFILKLIDIKSCIDLHGKKILNMLRAY